MKRTLCQLTLALGGLSTWILMALRLNHGWGYVIACSSLPVLLLLALALLDG